MPLRRLRRVKWIILLMLAALITVTYYLEGRGARNMGVDLLQDTLPTSYNSREMDKKNLYRQRNRNSGDAEKMLKFEENQTGDENVDNDEDVYIKDVEVNDSDTYGGDDEEEWDENVDDSHSNNDNRNNDVDENDEDHLNPAEDFIGVGDEEVDNDMNENIDYVDTFQQNDVAGNENEVHDNGIDNPAEDENGDETGDTHYDDNNDEKANGEQLDVDDLQSADEGEASQKKEKADSSQLRQSSNVRKLILLTYMRSGSTFTGNLIQQSPDVLYVFEPLWTIQKLYSDEKGLQYLHKEPVKHLNHDDFYEPHSLSVDTVKGFLDCRTEDVDIATLRSKFMVSSWTTRGLWRCMAEAKTDEQIQKCTDGHTSECLKARVTSVKVIRMTMKQVRKMMQDDPAVRVLHLIRDLRGMLHSQAKYIFRWKNLRPESKQSCARMYEDLTEHAKIAKEFPNRTLLVRYEDIVMSPLESLAQIYDLVGLKVTDKINSFAEKNTGDKSLPYKWRFDMTLEYVSIIDEECKDVSMFMGYRPFKSNAELVNETLSPVEPTFAESSPINKVVVTSSRPKLK